VNSVKELIADQSKIREHLKEIMPSYIERAWQAGEELKLCFKGKTS
jgi:hypothetical protein